MFTVALLLAALTFFVWRSGRLGPPEVPSRGASLAPRPGAPGTVSPMEGHIAPDFEATTLGGRPVRLSELRGKAVFLNFWAPWCGPCRMEMAAIDNLHAQSSDEVAILTIAVESSEAHVRRFVERHRVTLPVIHDLRGEVGTRFQISGIPTTVLIDPQGVVVRRIVGPRAWDRPEFVAWLSALASATGQ